MEGIAAEAGVGKQTIYRWWPSRAAVVLEALRELASARIAVPDSGTLRSDLELFLSATFTSAELLPEGARLLRGLMAEAQLDERFREELTAQLIEPRRRALRELFERAQARGELRRDFDFGLGVDLAFGVMWYRLLLELGPLDESLAADLARAIARAAERGS
jgi:AcrR family transcriptional regulator